MTRLRFLVILAIPVFVSCKSPRALQSPARELGLSPALKGAHTGISITDAVTGKPVFGYQENKYFVPASNTKIFTCYAAMKYLGDSLPALRYRVAGDGALEIAGTGDPSLLQPEFSYQPVIELLKKYPKIRWIEPIFDQALGSGWAWDDYHDSYMVQRSPMPVYGNIARFRSGSTGVMEVVPDYFLSLLKPGSASGAGGFSVERDWDRNEFTILDGGHQFQEVPFNANMGTIRELLEAATGRPVESDPFGSLSPVGTQLQRSLPVDSLLLPMMHRSDNFYAEQVLMMVSMQLLHRFDIPAVIDSLLKTELRQLPQAPRWEDGSGLSRYNLFSPLDFTTILHNMLSLPRGKERMIAVFPAGGEGTLRNYFVSPEPFIHAKTGTLSGVVTLSGMLRASSGRELLFSVLVNNNRASAADVRADVEKFLLQVRDRY